MHKRERIHALWVICTIVVGVPGLVILAESLHLDTGAVKELYAVSLASLTPAISRIVSFYFPPRK